MRTRLLDDLEDDDPILSVVNLIDVFLVIIAALLLAVANSAVNPFGSESVTVIKNPGKENMEIITKEGEKINRYTPSENQDSQSGKRGKKVGIAYELENGEIIYVPE